MKTNHHHRFPNLFHGIRHLFLGFMAILATCAVQAKSELTFASTFFEIEATPSDKVIPMIYTFTNSGDETIEIIQVVGSCDCTTTQFDKKIYKPGETGQIKATFTIGERVGDQFNKILVKTKTKDISYPLSFKINIPQLVILSPKLLYWKKGETGSKTIRIQCPEKSAKAVSVSLKTIFDTTHHELKTVEEGRIYDVVVTPKDAGEEFREQFSLEIDLGPLGKRHEKAYAIRK